jgi:hypothetical protein
LTDTLGKEDITGDDGRSDAGGRDPAQKALDFARTAHDGQVDRFGRDFILHPVAVAELSLPFAGDAGLIPAYLHDTVEKAGTDAGLIEELFGPEARRMIVTLGQDPSIADSAARRDDHRLRVRAAGPVEKIVYLSDRRDGVLTMTELVRSGRDPVEFGGVERLELWKGDLEAVGTNGIDPDLIAQLEVELDLLEDLLREPPG